MYNTIVCTHCKQPHFTINKDGVDVLSTQADEHGAWESGKGETLESSVIDALIRAGFVEQYDGATYGIDFEGGCYYVFAERDGWRKEFDSVFNVPTNVGRLIEKGEV